MVSGPSSGRSLSRDEILRLFARQGEKVVFEAIDKPQSEWKSLLDVFENSYKHEQKVTGLIET
jgi:ferritin